MRVVDYVSSWISAKVTGSSVSRQLLHVREFSAIAFLLHTRIIAKNKNIILYFYIHTCSSTNQTCRTLLEKQGRTHKWYTLMDPHTWPCKSRTTSTNIHSATMWGYGMLSRRPAWGDERKGKVAREGQGYPCYQHDMMMMMMILYNTKIEVCFRFLAEEATVKLEATFSGKHRKLFITVVSLGVSVGVLVERTCVLVLNGSL